MAETFKVGEFPDVADRGAFHATMSAIASNDPKRIARAGDEALTALSCVGTMLNGVADYLNLRGQHPGEAMYATDRDVADAVYSLSDLTACVHSSMNAAFCARNHLKETAGEVPANRSKEG